MAEDFASENKDSVSLRDLSKLAKKRHKPFTTTPKVYDPFRNVTYFKKRKVLPELTSGPLNSLLGKYGLEQKMLSYDFVKHWPEIVGEGIAKYARPNSFKDGLLVVRVKDSSWAQELNFQKDLIKNRLNTYFMMRNSNSKAGVVLDNQVRDIYFSVKD